MNSSNSKSSVEITAALHGFNRWETGGGCTALHREWAKHYALITAIDSPEMPETEQEACVLGFYFNEQDHSEACVQFNCPNLADALAIAAKFNGDVGLLES